MGAGGAEAGLTFRRQVWRVVRRIPRGRVATYGQIAALAGRPRAARGVGQAMRECPPDVPWHRVVNAQGGISPRGGSASRRAAGGRGPRARGEPVLMSSGMLTQRLRLAAEGVVLRGGRVALARHRWRGKTERRTEG